MEAELALLLGRLRGGSGAKPDVLFKTYSRLWEMLTYSASSQQECVEVSKHCNQTKAYPALFHFAHRDAQTALRKKNHELLEFAIKVLAWCLNQDRSGEVKLRSLAQGFLIDTYFAVDQSCALVSRTCVWALRIIPGGFPPGLVERALEVMDKANASQCPKTLEECAGLMKGLAENSLPELERTKCIVRFVVPVVTTAFGLNVLAKRRQKASDALWLCLPGCWDVLDQLSTALSPHWDAVAHYINASVNDLVGSLPRKHVAKYMGFVLLLFGPSLGEKDPSTKRIRLNALMHAQHALLSKSSSERVLAITGWRLMIESAVVQHRLVDHLPILRKVTKEGFNAGWESDGLVRLETFYTWTYLAQVVLLLDRQSEVDLTALFGTLRRALSDSDLRVRTAAAAYAVQLIRFLQRPTPATAATTTTRRHNILRPMAADFACSLEHQVSLADLIGLFENTLRQYPELDCNHNLELWKACAGMWAGAISVSRSDGEESAQPLSPLGEELGGFVWKEICSRFVGDSQVECIVAGVGNTLLFHSSEFVQWVLKVFNKRAVPAKTAARTIELCGGLDQLAELPLTSDLFRMVVAATGSTGNQWMGRIFAVVNCDVADEDDNQTLPCWEAKFVRMDRAEKRSFVLQHCVGDIASRRNLLACRAALIVCTHVKFTGQEDRDCSGNSGGAANRLAIANNQLDGDLLATLAKFIAHNIARVVDNQSILLDCAAFLLDNTSEREDRFRLVLDCLFAPQTGGDALINRTLSLLINRMKRLDVLYEQALITGLQAQDRGIRNWVAEFWNYGTLATEASCTPKLVEALQSAKREFPNLRGISALKRRAVSTPPPSTTVTTAATTASHHGSLPKQPRMSEKKDKQVRLGFTTYSGLDASQPIFPAFDKDSSEGAGSSSPPLLSPPRPPVGEEQGETLQDLTVALQQLALRLTRDASRLLVAASGSEQALAFENASQDLLLALWRSKS
ncbi:hypothetical protein BASA81_006135 [Batrachochytrium salamandrivorans]|nr:hypothetical protein BASA81_006135 [Batrachochytrium salamandrivorans]